MYSKKEGSMSRTDKALTIIQVVAAVLLIYPLSACARPTTSPTPGSTPLPIVENPVFTQTSGTLFPIPGPTIETVFMLSPTPTIDHYQEWLDWLATRPRDMESYGRIYDQSAVAELPPRITVNMPIWHEELPLLVIDHEPEFVDSIPPVTPGEPDAVLSRVGCARENGAIICAEESPWQVFKCDELITLGINNTGLPPEIHFYAECLIAEDEKEGRDSYLYRKGCAFRKNVAYIIGSNNDYRLIRTPLELQEIWQPIETPEEALSYALLMTGLSATYHFEGQPNLLYFKDPIEGTRVTEKDGEYLINLFHYQTCLCEPWDNSEVYLLVDREGVITWLGALPISMTIGFGCAD